MGLASRRGGYCQAGHAGRTWERRPQMLVAHAGKHRQQWRGIDELAQKYIDCVHLAGRSVD